MEWIGQHIWKWASRFRNDVYLEDISSGTIASGGNLGLDSNNKIVKQSDTGITDLHGAGVDGSNNQLLTDDGDGTITSEANLTFDGSALNLTGTADISPSDEAERAALTIDNDDTDQIALDIDASNTTANIVDIASSTLTTGSGLLLNIDDTLTTTADKSLINIDYDKSGVTGASQTCATTGLNINLADAATNNAAANVSFVGARIDLDAANAQGSIKNQGLIVNVAADGVGDAANTYGVELNVMDGGTDIKMVSHANTSDYCTITTTTNGATTIRTVDADAESADFEIAADGNIILDPTSGIVKIDDGHLWQTTSGTGSIIASSQASSSTSGGGRIQLRCDDGAAMGNGHRIGVIEFKGAEDSSSNKTIGARIEAMCDAAWSASENGGRLDFYTTDGNASQSKVLTLDSDKNATFGGNITALESTLQGVKIDGDKGVTVGDGNMIHVDTTTLTDNVTSGSGTATRFTAVNFEGPTLAATNSNVTTTDAATLYVRAAPSAGTNQTITNAYALWIDAGNTRLDGDLYISTSKILSDSGGTTTLSNIDALDSTTEGTIESAIDTLANLTSIGSAGATTNFVAGDITIYNAVNDGNPTISLGSSATERLEIKAEYESGAQGLDVVRFTSFTAGSSADDSRFVFEVDDTFLFSILDDGLLIKASGNLEIGDGNEILSDSSGTTTLKNIDALDATTEATIESAIDTLGNLTSASSLATVGTIGTGVWEGTAVASDQQKHLMHYELIGYATGDGTNYEIPVNLTDNQAKWEHNTSTGSAGTTAITVQNIQRSGGLVMPRACTLKKWTGWATCSGSAETHVALFKITPTRNDNSDVSPVLLDDVEFTALGNAKMEDFAETSFTDAAIAAGDIIVSGVKADSGATCYFTSTIEVEF